VTRVVLCIHGIRTDANPIAWRQGLDAALRLEGLGDLESRGWTTVAPEYMDLLTIQPEPSNEPPPPTYARSPDDQHQSAAGDYWLACSRLEAALGDTTAVGPGPIADIPADQIAKHGIPLLFPYARTYCSSSRRRNAIQRRVLDAIPDDCELVIIGYSLGSVVAVDLLYHLPTSCNLRLLVTMGSPMGLKEISSHLRRVRSSFPFEITGPWLNLVGRADLVAAGRGISRMFPEVVDVYVDTGWTSAHEPDKYLAQAALVRAFGWLQRSDESTSDRLLPELTLPVQLIPVVAFAQYALRLGQAQKPGSQRTRFEAARMLMAETVRQELLDHDVSHPIIDRLAEDNADQLRGRFRGQPVQLIDALFRAHMSNPVAPYEINTPQVAKGNALRSLATDLGAPSSWADAVITAVEAARKAHEGFPVGRVALGAAAAALFVTAPYLVVAAAPAGAAGGAAIVGGLAALGPGGMLGGLVVVGAVGGAGGAAAIGALTAGSPATVAELVVSLQAHALACSNLGHREPGSQEWFTLTTMESQLANKLARHTQLDDRKSPTRDQLDQKLKTVRTAITWLAERGLGPPSLPAAAGLTPLPGTPSPPSQSGRRAERTPE
jgi:hypothetical protein